MEEEREEKIRQAFQKIKEDMDFLKQDIQEIKKELTKISIQHTQHTIPAHPQQSSTYSQEYEGIKPQFSISTRNRGVPADSQQTSSTQLKDLFMNKPEEQSNKLSLRQLNNVVNNLTQEIKAKFKNLSKQEFYIFSLVYNLDVIGQKPDYKTLAVKANLTESSVRDYIARLIHKGIPIKKERINNKEIKLSIPDEFKNLATLDSLRKLKEGNFF